jgi:hypothetical protein
MQVRVKSLQGDEYLIQVQNEQTVHQLKASISEKANGLPIDRQKLVYKGRTMQDTSLISEYQLEEDCKVHLIIQKEREPSSTNQNASSSQEANTSNPSSSANPLSSQQSSRSQCPVDLRNNEEVIRMLGRWGAAQGPPVEPTHEHTSYTSRDHDIDTNSNSGNQQPQSRLEMILRERLAAHFPSGSIDRIMDNLYKEIDADINASSLDDLERLAKQKLNITNE